MEAALFGLRLKELRSASGLTQPQLAERAGLSAAAIAQWEVGRREPSWSGLLALCKALGCQLNDFAQAPTQAAKPSGRGRPAKTAIEPAKKARKK